MVLGNRLFRPDCQVETETDIDTVSVAEAPVAVAPAVAPAPAPASSSVMGVSTQETRVFACRRDASVLECEVCKHVFSGAFSRWMTWTSSDLSQSRRFGLWRPLSASRAWLFRRGWRENTCPPPAAAKGQLLVRECRAIPSLRKKHELWAGVPTPLREAAKFSSMPFVPRPHSPVRTMPAGVSRSFSATRLSSHHGAEQDQAPFARTPRYLRNLPLSTARLLSSRLRKVTGLLRALFGGGESKEDEKPPTPPPAPEETTPAAAASASSRDIPVRVGGGGGDRRALLRAIGSP